MPFSSDVGIVSRAPQNSAASLVFGYRKRFDFSSEEYVKREHERGRDVHHDNEIKLTLRERHVTRKM